MSGATSPVPPTLLRLFEVLILAGLSAALLGCPSPGGGRLSVTGTVLDEANSMPVYRARVSFGGRSTTLYKARTFRLSGLSSQEGTLRVEAPGYHPVQVPLALGRKDLTVDLTLKGAEVPGLAGILAWTAWESGALRIDIRLVDGAGITLEHFPCLPFRAQARLAENLGTRDAPRQGRLLFEGTLEVAFDPAGGLDKLKSRIPRESIAGKSPGIPLGILELALLTDQGRFTWTRGDVVLEAGP